MSKGEKILENLKKNNKERLEGLSFTVEAYCDAVEFLIEKELYVDFLSWEAKKQIEMLNKEEGIHPAIG
jgi:hypothetical protein